MEQRIPEKPLDHTDGHPKELINHIDSIITFTIAGISCCANLEDISAIIDTREISQDSNLDSNNPHIVLGKHKVPIIDIYKINGLPAYKKDGNERLLVVEIEGNLMAFSVEKVDSVFYLDKMMKNKIKFTKCKSIMHLNGMINYDEQILFLLDLKDMINKGLAGIS